MLFLPFTILVLKEFREVKNYSVGENVVISKRLNARGEWKTVEPEIAKIVEVRETVSLGPAHTLEVNGEILHVCYWADDIDGKVSDKIYDDPDYLWKAWGDK